MPASVPDRSAPDVLFVADGASVHTRRLLRALVERDVRAELASFEPCDVAGVIEHRLGSLAPERDIRYAVAVPALAGRIRALRPRIVHAHYVSSYGVMAALALRLVRGARLVQTAWGTDLLITARTSRVHRALARIALRAADLVTGDSLELRREAAALAPGRPFLRFVFGPERSLLEAEGGRERLIVSMRRLEPDMRVERAVLGFRRARELAPDALAGWRLLVAGDGASSDAVRAAAGGDPEIELAGRLDQPALRARIARAAVQVSVPSSDTTSAALLDGLAAGLVPVVSDLPGPREWVDSAIGEIVPRDPSVEDIARAIASAVARDVPRDRLRERVREVTWDREVERLVGAYRGLAPAGAPLPGG